MVSMLKRSCAAALVAVLVAAAPALAVDAPKWVAALYVDAQKAVGLRWMPAPGATGYKVLRSETAGSGYAEIASTAQPQHFDTSVEPGSTYYYVLQAVAGAEVSPNSDEKSLKIPGQKKVATKPPEFTRVSSQSSTEFGKTVHKVGLAWGPVTGAIAYNVYRSETSGKDYQLLLSGAETQAVDTTVVTGKTYFYVVTALDGSFMETPHSAEKTVNVIKSKRKKRKKRIKLKVKGRPSDILWSREKEDQPAFGFWEPYDVALSGDENRVYATSNATGEIYVLNARNGETVAVIGEKGEDEGQLLYPLGIHVTKGGDLYVADRTRRSVSVFDANSGAFEREIPLVLPPGEDKKRQPEPMDVLVDEASGEIYVSDRGIDKIWVLDANGEFIRFLGVQGKELGQIAIPMYIRWDREGNLVVLNGGNAAVSTYNKADGAHLRSIGKRAPVVGAFIFIAGFDWDVEGNVLVADKSSSNIQALIPDGRYLYHVGDAGGEKGAEMFAPKSIAIDSQNRVYVVEGLVNRIQAFQLKGDPPEPQQPPPDAEE